VISPSVQERERLEKELGEYFELSPQTGSKISYLGLIMTNSKTRSKLDRLKKFPTNPTTTTFLKSDPISNKLGDNKEYLLIIMTLMDIARYTRQDILMPVSFLTTRSSAPTTDEHEQSLSDCEILGGQH
jgi:hypothetical protein